MIGSVFQAVDLIKSDHTVLVKSRPRSSYYHDPCPLKHECAVLGDLRGLQGVPDIIWSGPSGTEYEHNVVVFEDLGPTLHDVFKSSGGSLPARTVATLAEQLVGVKRVNNLLGSENLPDSISRTRSFP